MKVTTGSTGLWDSSSLCIGRVLQSIQGDGDTEAEIKLESSIADTEDSSGG